MRYAPIRSVCSAACPAFLILADSAMCRLLPRVAVGDAGGKLKNEAGRHSVRSPRPVSRLARGCVVVACHVEEPPLVGAGTAQIRDSLEAEDAVAILVGQVSQIDELLHRVRRRRGVQACVDPR